MKIDKSIIKQWVHDDFIRPIEGYDDLYYASKDGNIVSLVSEPKILKPCPDRAGYTCVFLYKNKKRRTFKVHRLIARAFLDNPNELPCVNHKDEIKDNNHVRNLEWCTHRYNSTYNGLSKRIGIAQSKPVAQIDNSGKVVKVWTSASEAGRSGFASNAIAACALGRYGHKTHKGYKWVYI